MTEYVRGLVVRSRAGHDKGDFLAVLQVEDGWALVGDGKGRPLERHAQSGRAGYHTGN